MRGEKGQVPMEVLYVQDVLGYSTCRESASRVQQYLQCVHTTIYHPPPTKPTSTGPPRASLDPVAQRLFPLWMWRWVPCPVLRPRRPASRQLKLLRRGNQEGHRHRQPSPGSRSGTEDGIMGHGKGVMARRRSCVRWRDAAVCKLRLRRSWRLVWTGLDG